MFDHYQGLAHIAIRTLDVEKSIEFYEKIGGKVVIADILGTDKGRMDMALLQNVQKKVQLVFVIHCSTYFFKMRNLFPLL